MANDLRVERREGGTDARPWGVRPLRHARRHKSNATRYELRRLRTSYGVAIKYPIYPLADSVAIFTLS